MSTDKGSSLFWLFVSLVVSIEAYRLGLGSLKIPGMGFMSFGAAVLLGILSIACFIQAAMQKDTPKPALLFRGMLWRQVILVFVALLAYAYLLPLGGYNISTFLLMTFLFYTMEHQKVWKVVLYALLTTGITYYVFSKWLNCQFPVGSFGF